MSSGSGSDRHHLDKKSIVKEQPQQLSLDISAVSLPAVESPLWLLGIGSSPEDVRSTV